ncbi:MAG: hypothetical protein KC492_04680 [Myxococcales bacterium]|nr:hypothetical protein [Myxococcales bacterium]MCB9610156.1 hypothetical protein [Polyangiaceae bacterium]
MSIQFYVDDVTPSADHPCECCHTTDHHALSCSVGRISSWFLHRRTLRLTPYQAVLTEALTKARFGDTLTETEAAVLKSHGGRGSSSSPIALSPALAAEFGLTPYNPSQ